MKTKKTLKPAIIAALAVLLVFTITALSLTGCDNGSTTPPPASHTYQWGEWQVTTAADCTTAGVETRVCALDAAYKETRPITALGHDWGEWSVTAATCETPAGEIRTCKRDSSHFESKNVTAPALGHDWGEWSVTAVTCETPAGETRTCKHDPSHIDVKNVTSPALGHNFANYTQTTAPTCTTAGVETGTCTHDGTTTTRPIPIDPNAHDWKNDWKVTAIPTIAREGVETDTCAQNTSHTRTRPYAVTIATVAELTTYLNGLPYNTAATAYKIALNDSDISTLRTALKNADKYVYLDLSGSAITEIPDYAFNTGSPSWIAAGCYTLTGITIPDSVTSIGQYAFYFCTSLASVTIPNSVTSIGQEAFYDCTSLASITIPDSVTSIGSSAFGSCASLTAITVDAANANYVSEDGVLYNKAVTTLIQYPAKKGSSFTIPSSVTSIGGGAFNGCRSLASVTIPNSVTSIGLQAFYGCTSLASITIPDSVTSIGVTAFRYCVSLTSVTIPNSVTSIGSSAFYDCTSLASVTFATGSDIAYADFGDYAFPEGSGVSYGNSLKDAYATGKAGTYTRPANGYWTKQ